MLHLSSPVPLPDRYFDLFSYPVAPIVSSAGGIVLIYLSIACRANYKLCLESYRLSPSFTCYSKLTAHSN